MEVQEYLKQVKSRFNAGISTEHSYRSDLQTLLNNIVDDITVTNEPKRLACGAPDFIIQKGEIPVGYIEAKDIGVDLDQVEKSEQLERYLSSLDNLILTDYLEFRFYRFGNKVATVEIASIENGKLVPHPNTFDLFTTHIKDFCAFLGQTIKSSEKLAKMMAQKARMMENIILNAVTEDGDEYNSLKAQFNSFKKILIHDLNEKTFSDIYAQTIAYGLFTARLHDKSMDTFSRQEARDLIPRTNPFLRNLFDYISGAQLDERIVWIVDDLCEIFRATDLKELLSDFGKTTGQNDPFLHFYETFLAEYDPKLRKSRGVYYTPEPVVNFIVRAVDDILKEEFGLTKGLADTSKVKIKQKVDGTATKKGSKDIYEEKEVHKVQILDPATGTGTFLSETIKQIYSNFKGQEGLWSSYVDEHLIPRVHGFEILMASYTMCHLKLEMLLNETGYKPKDDRKQSRLKVYLTNSLEEFHPDTGMLLTQWLSNEANEANRIKRDTPVMVVMGNPPYSGISSNKGAWISELIEEYKYVNGVHFNERKHWLNDDYVKFLRYGQHFIENKGIGIMAYINPHGFLDNPTFRGMRWNLLKTFDKIFTIDLHGNSNKKEKSPDGSVDKNVFDIQQGVSINIFIKTGKKKTNKLGEVFHFDKFGERKAKYNFLNTNNLNSINFINIRYSKPYYFFIPKDESEKRKYETYIKLDDLFPIKVTGIVTARDSVVIDISKEKLKKRMNEFTDYRKSDEEIRNYLFPNKKAGKYLPGDSRGWKLSEARKKIKDNVHEEYIKKVSYRPFDTRYIYYSPNMVDWGRENYMKHFLNKINLGIDACRQLVSEKYSHIFITDKIVDDSFVSNKSRERGYVFPLYLIKESNLTKNYDFNMNREPNIDIEIIHDIEEKLNFTFTNEKEDTEKTFSPLDLLDYIYAVLHSPTYREKYKEFLRIDFPRIPYPEGKDTFLKLVELGRKLRTIHLLENPIVEEFTTSYPISGSNKVEKISYKERKVFINKEQYFANIPELVWNFYIGGYQPAQKWLKDRKGRELSTDDIFHYQKIIVALTETDRIMKKIDQVVEF